MVSLRERVHTWRKENPKGTKKELYKTFSECNKNSLRTYYNSYKPFHSDISNTVEIENIDTIKEMTYSIQQIEDPVKRCENLSRLHNMMLKPIVNKNEKSLVQMFEEIK